MFLCSGMNDAKLTKPLCFLDAETTGLILGKDRIIQLAVLKWNTDYSTRIKSWMIKPDIPISPESLKIHGITPEMLEKAPSFKEVANEIVQFIGNADLAGYNSNRFDVPMLMDEFHRAGVEFSLEGRNLLDVSYIFNLMEPRTLSAAYAYFCNKELKNAHNAEEDVKATFEIFLAQLNKYENTEIEIDGKKVKPVSKNIKEMGEFFKSRNRNLDLAGRITLNEEGIPCFSFGKYKGQKVFDVFRKDTSYYHWIMNGDFSHDTKNVITRLYLQFKRETKSN
jgi:DNA polymerase-3 subunit epsilon